MTHEQIKDDEIFFKEVWCSPSNAKYKLLIDNGHNDEDIKHMFEVGTMFEKVRELSTRMSSEDRLTFYTWNC